MRLRDEDRLTPDLVFRDPYLLDFLQRTSATRTCWISCNGLASRGTGIAPAEDPSLFTERCYGKADEAAVERREAARVARPIIVVMLGCEQQ
jgi:hypothetical protein